MNQTEPKAEYTTPQLIVYGNVEDLTRGGINVSVADNLSDVVKSPRKP
jgi:hypothetical protein